MSSNAVSPEQNEQESKEQLKSDDVDEEEAEVDNPDTMQPQKKLFYFAKRGNVEGIKSISSSIPTTIDINATDEEGFKNNPYITKNTALHYAVESGNLECVKILYNLEAKLDATNKLGSTPLHIASALGCTEIVKFLISMKADIEAKNVIQNTPLHCAVYAGHVETVQAILEQLDEPRQALLEQNGVGMGAVKYTAHDKMKVYLRDKYFPKPQSNEQKPPQNNDIVEEEENDATQYQE